MKKKKSRNAWMVIITVALTTSLVNNFKLGEGGKNILREGGGHLISAEGGKSLAFEGSKG
jgi:hypothetical protein